MDFETTFNDIAVVLMKMGIDLGVEKIDEIFIFST